MKFSVSQDHLVKGLQVVNRIATTRSTLPILGNILLQTDKGKLKLVTTDLELAIDTLIEATVENEGAITIPARTFTDFVTNNTDTTIEFSLKDTVLEAKSAHFTAEMKGIDALEFPSIPTIESKDTITIPALNLKEAISQTVFATTADETRPVLSGVALFITNQELKMVATDSYRLAEKKLILEKSDLATGPVIVPTRTLLELSRLITDETAQITMRLDKHQLVVDCDTSHIVSRLIEGTFPAYEAIIPKKLDITATMNRQELIGALKIASLFSRDSAYNVSVTVSKDQLSLKSVSAQIGASTSTVVASVTGGELTMSFNARFILDALQVMTGEAVQLLLHPPHDTTWFPGIFKSTEDSNYQYVVMPLRGE